MLVLIILDFCNNSKVFFEAIKKLQPHAVAPLLRVRDKDGNASSLAIAEAFAYMQSTGTSPLKFLDTIYQIVALLSRPHWLAIRC